MQLKSKFNKGIQFLLCTIDIFSKYPWVAPLNDKKSITIVKTFQEILNESSRKPNKIWVDKRSKFCNRSMKICCRIMIWKCIQHNERKSVALERFIRILNNKIYKYKTSVSAKCVY